MTKKSWFTLIAVLIILVGFAYPYLVENREAAITAPAQQESKEKKYPEAPDFTLQDLEGNMVTLSDYKGKVVIIDFWATWCGPCRKGIPDFVELQSEYGRDNLVILGINLDQGGVNGVKAFAKQYKINYPVLLPTQQVVAMYGGIRAIPTTFIIDRKGQVRQGFEGYRPKDYFVNVLAELI
jgi:cytochrome c biogenesis protein CcmG/thiol:disulfide interchange protein DsbE